MNKYRLRGTKTYKQPDNQWCEELIVDQGFSTKEDMKDFIEYYISGFVENPVKFHYMFKGYKLIDSGRYQVVFGRGVNTKDLDGWGDYIIQRENGWRRSKPHLSDDSTSKPHLSDDSTIYATQCDPWAGGKYRYD